ncbi:MAG: hypothetical protein ACKPGN_15915, partial [Dolichospermum sp.]
MMVGYGWVYLCQPNLLLLNEPRSRSVPLGIDTKYTKEEKKRFDFYIIIVGFLCVNPTYLLVYHTVSFLLMC